MRKLGLVSNGHFPSVMVRGGFLKRFSPRNKCSRLGLFGFVLGSFFPSIRLRIDVIDVLKLGLDWVWIGFAFFVGLGVEIVVSTSFASSCSDSRIQEIGFASQKKYFKKHRNPLKKREEPQGPRGSFFCHFFTFLNGYFHF